MSTLEYIDVLDAIWKNYEKFDYEDIQIKRAVEFALDIFFRFDRIDFREVKYLRNHSDYYITTNDDTEAHITIHKKGSEKTLMI